MIPSPKGIISRRREIVIPLGDNLLALTHEGEQFPSRNLKNKNKIKGAIIFDGA